MDKLRDRLTASLPNLQDFVPYLGRCSATLWNLTILKEQGKGTTDFMMPLGDWFKSCFFANCWRICSSRLHEIEFCKPTFEFPFEQDLPFDITEEQKRSFEKHQRQEESALIDQMSGLNLIVSLSDPRNIDMSLKKTPCIENKTVIFDLRLRFRFVLHNPISFAVKQGCYCSCWW